LVGCWATAKFVAERVAAGDLITRRSRVRIPPPLLPKGPRKRALGVRAAKAALSFAGMAGATDAARAEFLDGVMKEVCPRKCG
jgi:hypothetical protein